MSDDHEMEEVNCMLGHINHVRLRPDDVIVVHTTEHISMQMAEHIRDRISSVLANKVIVLDSGLRLSIFSKTVGKKIEASL